MNCRGTYSRRAKILPALNTQDALNARRITRARKNGVLIDVTFELETAMGVLRSANERYYRALTAFNEGYFKEEIGP